MFSPTSKRLFLVLALIFSSQSFAATVKDDFTQGAVNDSPAAFAQTTPLGNGLNWVAIAPACLTAGTKGDGTSGNNSTTVSSTASNFSNIPACSATTGSGIASDAAADPVGGGALRLTNNSNDQAGAIVSQGTFPSNQGLQITFTTYTYGGNGADGIGFFLQDGAVPTSLPLASDPNITTGNYNIGESGGSLGYTCSNYKPANYNGLTGAYLGLGMDEYGNFLNGSTPILNSGNPVLDANGNPTYTAHDNTASGSGSSPNTISMRGAGNVSWYWLNSNYPLYYPSTLTAATRLAAVENTCKTGKLWDYNGATSQTIASATYSGTTLTVTAPGVGGYTNGDSVTIGGAITATTPNQTISVSSSGATLTVTVPSVSGYSNGQTVTIGGTFNVNPIISSGISFSSYNAGPPKTVRVNVASANTKFSVGESVVISGVTGPGNALVNGTFTIAGVTGTYFTIQVSNTVTTAGLSGGTVTGTTPTIPGTYAISNLNPTNKTFTVTLSAIPLNVSSISGTVTGPVLTIPGTYTIANVTSNTFDVTLSTAPNSVTYTSGTVVNNSLPTSGRQLSATVQDYAVIPGSAVVLPANTLTTPSASTRANAKPMTYRMLITPGGLLSYMYSYNGGTYQPVLTNFPITSSNGPLPATFRFGFLGSTGGLNNIHELSCFVAEPIESTSSAGANTVQAGQVRTGTQVYLASFNPNNWTGSLTSNDIKTDTSGVLSVAPNARWDGNCVLTGGGCASMGAVNGVPTNTITVEAPSSRQLLTWDGTSGVSLQSGSLTNAQLDWLRGGRTNEQTATPAGLLRARAGVLGDIVNSSPTWIGPPSMGYGSTFADSIYGTGPETSYASFVSSMATRQNVVYAGGNDGFLHGFRAGSVDTSVPPPTHNFTNDDGYEVIGFMPSSVLANANVVGLTSPTYGHNYFVDGTPGFGDLFYNGAWHTWLVGGLGEGGAEIYVLDVTDPTGAVTSTKAFSETNAANLVIGDWTSSTLTTCVHAATSCGDNLGKTYGTPIIRRLHNGKWAIIFGNGFGSTNNHAGVFIGIVNSSSGAVTFNWLDTGVGSASSPNGIAYVASADLDGDHVTDYLYAGDLLGNVWRFDLTSSNSADWAVSTYGQPSAAPLFTATDSGGATQPITTKIAVTATTTGGATRVLLGFATGRAFPFTASAPTAYASGAQTVYGEWDWDMTAWNNGMTTTNSVVIPASPIKYAALSRVTTTPYLTFTRANNHAVSVATTSTTTNREVATSKVCWKGSSSIAGCSTYTQYGWLFDLPDANGTGTGTTHEQVIYNPVFTGGTLFLNTVIPPVVEIRQCTPSLPTGWTMAFDMASGGGETQNVFPDSSGGLVVGSGHYSLVGIKNNAVGTPYVISVGTQQYVVNQTIGDIPKVSQINPQGGVTVKQMSWEQLR